MKPVLVTTAHRGVFAGLIPDDQDLTVKAMPLKNARMAIYWGTTKGVMQLARPARPAAAGSALSPTSLCCTT